MIAAVCWLPKGAASQLPRAADRSAEEVQEFLSQELDDLPAEEEDVASSGNETDEDEEMQLGDEDAARAAARALGADAAADGLAELNMDDYDNEEEDIKIFGNGGLGCAYYKNGEKDPYLVDEDDDDDDDEERDDKTIRPSDLLLLAARNEDDVSHIEVWLYEEAQDNMYVHHEVMLPAVPLCLAWLDCNLKTGDKGNFVAVGSMQPDIEIWDLDVLDDVQPTVVLGGSEPVSNADVDSSSKKKKRKKKGVRLKEGSHSAAVLSLAWNNEFRNVLASGSADNSVKVWDIVTQKCEHTLVHHSDKVQAVAWNPTDATSLLSGSYDKTVVLTDMRAPSNEGPRWKIAKDVECVAWNPQVSHSFVVSSEDGLVYGFDVRATSKKGPNKSVFTIHAHEKATCAVSYNLSAPNLLATASMDKTVKLWDVANDTPSCIASNSPGVGAIFTASFCKDSPFLLAVGGSKGALHIWNTLNESEVSRRYSQ